MHAMHKRFCVVRSDEKHGKRSTWYLTTRITQMVLTSVGAGKVVFKKAVTVEVD